MPASPRKRHTAPMAVDNVSAHRLREVTRAVVRAEATKPPAPTWAPGDAEPSRDHPAERIKYLTWRVGAAAEMGCWIVAAAYAAELAELVGALRDARLGLDRVLERVSRGI